MNLKVSFGNRIQIQDQVSDWKEAIRMVMEPLVNEGYCQERYISAIYESVKKNGDYFLLLPGFALPHTTPENGCIKTGLSLLKLKKPVLFSGGEPVTLLIGLSASGADEHLDMLGELANILMEEENVERLFHAQTKEEFLKIFE